MLWLYITCFSYSLNRIDSLTKLHPVGCIPFDYWKRTVSISDIGSMVFLGKMAGILRKKGPSYERGAFRNFKNRYGTVP